MKINLRQPKDIQVRKVTIRSNGHPVPMLILSPETNPENRIRKSPGILWIVSVK